MMSVLNTDMKSGVEQVFIAGKEIAGFVKIRKYNGSVYINSGISNPNIPYAVVSSNSY